MDWTESKEKQILALRESGETYSSIAKVMGISMSSAKHKVRRLQQSNNQDRYKHTGEKLEQIGRVISGSELKILETNCGFGSLTKHYATIGHVTAYDIVRERVEEVSEIPNVTAIKGDSEKELLKHVVNRDKFNVIDIDPYGYPSRYFPHVFNLIDDGVLILTFPMMGVAQMNKIMIQHYLSFWGISLDDKANYIDKITNRLFDYAFMCKRSIDVLEVERIDRIYRIALRVKKESLLNIVGLEVKRQ